MKHSASSGQSSLKIVLVHRYFYPDTPPYASILKEIALGLAHDDAEVTVLTCQPSYNRAAVSSAPSHERLGSHVDVVRWPVLDDRRSSLAKIINLAVFSARLAVRLGRMREVDVVMAASTPPVALAMVVSLVARAKGAHFVYHKQDIYPEVTDAGKQLPRPLRNVLRALDSATDRRADRVVVLSRDMARTTMARGTAGRTITVLNNFDPWRVSELAKRERRTHGEAVRFVYAGNLGRFQNFESLFGVLEHFATDDRVSFDFVGDGPMREPLEALVAKCDVRNVRVHGYVTPEVLAQMLRASFDVGIVSLHPGVIRSAYPSKTMSYLRNGLPVLALVESGTELAAMLDQYRAGWQADPLAPDALVEAIEGIVSKPEQLEKRSVAAREMYENAFGMQAQLKRWSQLFHEVGGLGR